MNSVDTKPFVRGQIVYYPTAPDGIAQVDEVCRRNIVIGWKALKNGRWRRKRLSPEALARLQKHEPPAERLLPLFNPFGRALRKAGTLSEGLFGTDEIQRARQAG